MAKKGKPFDASNPRLKRGLKVKRLPIVEKRTVEEWMAEDNLRILSGLAMQCMTLRDLAAVMQIAEITLKRWRAEYPALKQAIDIGREDADAVIIQNTFEAAATGDPAASERWWKYRIAMKQPVYEEETEGGDEERDTVVIYDRPLKRAITDEP
jgi:hypothetical protein